MGVCTSKPSQKPNLSDHSRAENDLFPPPEDGGGGNPRDQAESNVAAAAAGKKSPFFPFYSPSPAHYLFSKKSPVRSPANASSNSTPKRFFKRPFPPPSPARHIKALLARRQGTVKPNEASIQEGSETDSVGGTLDKSFGYSKSFLSKYEVGEEVGRGHFGYTRVATGKKGEMKGQRVAVKIIPKAKVHDSYFFLLLN